LRVTCIRARATPIWSAWIEPVLIPCFGETISRMIRQLGNSFFCIVVLLVLLGCLGVSAALAQKEAGDSAKGGLPAVAAAQPAPAASRVTAYSLPPQKLVRSRTLYLWSTSLDFFYSFWSIAVLAGVLLFGWSAHLRDWAAAITARPWLQGMLFLPPLFLFIALCDLPVSLAFHHLALVYGLSIQGWGSWVLDWLKGLLLNLVIGTLALSGIFALIRVTRRWWIWVWLASLPLQVLVAFLLPVVIDPMFNQFEPLSKSDPALVEQLERVVMKTGEDIPPSRMYLMRASRKVTDVNAYVTGFGASKRVVVWDTAIQKMSPDQILVIFGHELGHYVLGHILQGLALGSIFSFFFLWAFDRLSRYCVARYGARWRIAALGDWGAAVILLMLFSGLMFLSDPLSNTISRRIEHQADVFGLEVTHGIVADPGGIDADAFQRMGEQSLDYPSPNRFVVFWSYTHPTIAERIAFALAYHPWASGQHPQFFTRDGRLLPHPFFSIFERQP
jgi:STE24 endopeptidase